MTDPNANWTPDEAVAKKSHKKRNVLIVLAALAAIGLAMPKSDDTATADTDTHTSSTVASVDDSPKSGVTLANFNRIETGMTYSEVVAILGKAGTEISRVAGEPSIGLGETVMYEWSGRFLANMNAMFQGGELISKAQFGLK